MHPYFSKEIARGRRRDRLNQAAIRRSYNDARSTSRSTFNRRAS